MARVVWTGEALAHVEAIRIYIGQFDPAAAQRLAERLIDAGNRLRAFPRRGRSVGDGFRQLALSGDSYFHARSCEISPLASGK